MSAPPPASDDRSIGRVIDGRYRVLRRIGEGGMGVVYEAEHVKLGKHVAIKLIAPERIGDPESAARFTREARATAQIEHPHIAAGFDYGLLPEGGAFLVAQLVRGTSLRERIARGPMPWAEAGLVAAQIADALSAIHHAGYVHRDLTPDNVLVSSRDDGRQHVYVLDFGVAALVASAPSEGAALTTLGTIVGTQGYMAPEQALGKPVDARADLYVVGVLLWEMIAGRPLFSPRASLTDVVSSQLAGELPAAAAANAAALDLPFDVERLMRDLLSADVERRPASAIELRAELMRLIEAQPTRAAGVASEPRPATMAAPSPAIPALRAGAGDPFAPLRAQAEAAIAALGPVLRTRQAQGALAIGAAFGVVLAIALGALLAGGGDDTLATRGPKPAPGAASADPATVIQGADVPVPVPDAIATSIGRMMRSRSHREREREAARILEAPPSMVPPYARAAAGLEFANTCTDRAAQLELIGALGDPRALPAVERIRDAPRRGCGRGGRTDCYACVRDDAEVIIRALSLPAR